MLLPQSRTIGVDAGKSSLRFAALRKAAKGWSVVSLKEISGEENIELFYAQFKEDVLVSAIQTRDLLVRPCEIELKKPKDVFAALDFHVEPLLPYPLDQAVIQGQIINTQEKTTFVNVFALRKDHLAHHLDGLKNYHLEPEMVTTRPHALAALSTLLPKTSAPLLIVHEGEEELSIVLVENGAVLAARSLDLKKDLNLEIRKTLLSFASSHKTKTFESVYFFGKDQDLKNTLVQLSEKPVMPPSTPFLALTQEELTHYGLAIGTALAQKEINFRRKGFAYPYPFKHLKKPLSLFFALSLLLAGALFLFGQISLSQKKQGIEEAYCAFLKAENIAEVPPQNRETPSDYLSSLHGLEKEVRGRPATFPLLPHIPKVKEVISWLTGVVRPQGKGGHTLEIESLHYQIIKRPDFSHKQERYKVRVELEFSVQDPQVARSFLEALKSPQSLVDTHEEIQWLPAKGKYKASFYLKDKTKYT